MSTAKINRTHVVESDFIDKATNKRCLVIFNSMGIRCGYVEKNKRLQSKKYTKESILEEMQYSDDNIALNAFILAQRRQNKNLDILNTEYIVHGGVTFESLMISSENSEVSVLGFDFGHFSDTHDIEAYKRYFGNNTHMIKAFQQEDRLNSFNHNKKAVTTEEVENECKELAKQMAKVENKYLRKERKDKGKSWKNTRIGKRQWKPRKKR